MSLGDDSLLLYPLASLPDKEKTNRLNKGEFLDIITQFISNYIHQESSFLLNACTSASFTEFLETSFSDFLSGVCNKFNCCEYDILLFGIACLYYFIQRNITGPFDVKEDNYILRQFILDDNIEKIDEFARNIHHHLSPGDEFMYCNTKDPILLLLSKLVFQWLPKYRWKDWWLLRTFYIHQLLLNDPSPSVFKEVTTLMARVEVSLNSSDDSRLKILFNLEKIQIHLQLYSEISKTKPMLDSVLDDLGLKANLIGKMGKRTRFQERDLAQLTLNVDADQQLSPIHFNHQCTVFPKDQRSNDEVRLPQIKFIEEGESPSLSEFQQAALLAIFVLTKKSKPKDELQAEELTPYLMFLLSDPKVWCLQMAVLFFRSRLEAESSRTVERSITQIQSLISDSEAENPPAVERLPLLFCSFMQPKCKLEVTLAKLLVEVGAVQSALDIYNHLQMWEEIVACYNFLKLRHKAAEVVRQQMEKQETVQLWCLLGDATDDETCYQKAWELSNCKSAKAQKHWALYYFYRKKYEESIPHFQKSLEINSLQVPLWFNLGFAALILENWELSATSYRRYCSLEPDCFEAWNNLAKAYIKLGQKDRAWKALQDAVKCNYDNWKVWDNLMVVSTDCGDFHEVIRCYHRILDIKGKHVDVEVLKIFVTAIKNNCIEGDVHIVKKEGLKLFGRLTSLVMNDAEVWKLYASLTETTDDGDKHQKIVQYLQRAYRISTQDQNWDTSVELCKNNVDLCLKLSKAQKACSIAVNEQQRIQHLNSTKLALRGIISKLKKTHTDVFGVLDAKLVSEVENLQAELNEIESLIHS